MARDAAASPGVYQSMMLVMAGDDAGHSPVRVEPIVRERTSLARDDADFEALYRQRYRDVHRYVLLLTGAPDDAEDLAADAFSRAYGAWRAGHGPQGAPLPWLLRIARNAVTDRWRRKGLLRWLPLDRLEPRHETAALDTQVREAEFWTWFEALSRVLSHRQREVIILRYRRDLSDAEIGQIMGLTSSGVRSLAARALAALRSHPEIWT
ncbi:MAG: RNA polymerase sigma factor [Candidatus Limnocylindrales bacterium]